MILCVTLFPFCHQYLTYAGYVIYSSYSTSQYVLIDDPQLFRTRMVQAAVAARPKTYICGRSPAEIVGSNPTGGMDVCLL